jgi:hypothetical protein
MADVVKYAGDDEAGDPLFDMPLPIPERVEFDAPPTARMKQAIVDLFGMPLDLTSSQTSAILSCRDYGKQVADRLLERHPTRIRDLFAKLIMVFMLADESRLADVQAWSTRRFDRQSDGSAIGRTKRFAEVSGWVSLLISECRSAGAGFTR